MPNRADRPNGHRYDCPCKECFPDLNELNDAWYARMGINLTPSWFRHALMVTEGQENTDSDNTERR